MNISNKFLVGASIVAISSALPVTADIQDSEKGITVSIFLNMAYAQSRTCSGLESRPVVCRDHNDEIVPPGTEAYEKYCLTIGMKPSTTRDCTFSCGDGDGSSGDGDGDGDGGDPLVFDLDGNGVSLLSVDEGVMFDIDNDGELNQTGWVGPEDGLLVLDDNDNGIVDNQSELFGNAVATAYKNLADFDSNNDGVVNNQDFVWDNLQMWIDSNSDGISQSGELKNLAQLGITEIDAGYDTLEEAMDVEGNRITRVGGFKQLAADGVTSLLRDIGEIFLDFSNEDVDE